MAKGITNVKNVPRKAIQKERKSEAKKVQGRKPKVDLKIGRAKFCPKCQRAIPHANKKWGKNTEKVREKRMPGKSFSHTLRNKERKNDREGEITRQRQRQRQSKGKADR